MQKTPTEQWYFKESSRIQQSKMFHMIKINYNSPAKPAVIKKDVSNLLESIKDVWWNFKVERFHPFRLPCVTAFKNKSLQKAFKKKEDTETRDPLLL